MYEVEDTIETIHVYVVREEKKRSSPIPAIIWILALLALAAPGTVITYQQPEIRETLRFPAVFLDKGNFSQTMRRIGCGQHPIVGYMDMPFCRLSPFAGIPHYRHEHRRKISFSQCGVHTTSQAVCRQIVCYNAGNA